MLEKKIYITHFSDPLIHMYIQQTDRTQNTRDSQWKKLVVKIMYINIDCTNHLQFTSKAQTTLILFPIDRSQQSKHTIPNCKNLHIYVK